MSKAFTSEETEDGPRLVPPRAPLPRAAPNYVTPRGLQQLHDELEGLQQQKAGSDEANRPVLAARVVELEERIASAVVVDPEVDGGEAVRFGSTVTVVYADGSTRRFQIVGVDEAHAAGGLLAFTSPLARAVLGSRTGDLITLATPGGDEEITIRSVE